MSAVIIKKKDEDLFREISNILQKWSDKERSVFARAHYDGQSPESIAHSLKMDIDKVGRILRQCDRKLHTSLREFRIGGSCKSSLIPPDTSCPNVYEQEV